MNQFSQIEIANWVAIYLAAGLCCIIAIVFSVCVTVHSLWKAKAWNDVRTLRGALLFLPKAWWRWQKLYLLSTPVTLGIVCSFASTMSWSPR